jgi:hypothetical protein
MSKNGRSEILCASVFLSDVGSLQQTRESVWNIKVVTKVYCTCVVYCQILSFKILKSPFWENVRWANFCLKKILEFNTDETNTHLTVCCKQHLSWIHIFTAYASLMSSLLYFQLFTGYVGC